MGTIRVMYVGLKDRETDNKKGKSGVTWIGHGDIQDVPDWAWPALSKHPDVWVDVPAEPGAVVDTGLSAVLPPPAVKQEVDDADLVAQTVTIKPAENAPDPVAAEPAVESDSTPDLYGMNTAALRDYAVANGYAVDLGMKAKDLRVAIAAIEAAVEPAKA